MRRTADLWPGVVSFGALLDAARRAARGKREARSAAAFLERAELEVLALRRELADGTWRPGRPHRFEIRDPKPRTISAIPFRDQVVHHALIGALEPVFERRMIFDSYACRKGKGQHAALHRARRFVRRFGWYLKMDVQSFFPSVKHDVMLDALSRLVKDRRVVSLCGTILAGPPEDPPSDQGLPIGSLTSQWFANALLDRLDHHAKERLGIPGYLRYMDDFVLFADSRERLRQALTEVTAYLRDPLDLEPKERATMLAPTSEGLPFLGWMVHRGTLRVRPGNLRRYRWRLRQRRWEVRTGRRSPESYRAGVASIFQLLGAGQTLGLRRRLAEEVAMEM